jgi:hypothetical protein
VKRFLGGVGLLLIALLAIAFFSIDRIGGTLIERGTSYALGVETRVGFVRISPLTGSIRVRNLTVANPQGFESPHFVKMGRARLDVSLGTLREDTVNVPLFRLDGVELVLERDAGRTNYGAILRNMQRFESSDPTPPAAAGEAGAEKRFVVHDVVIRDVEARIDMAKEIGDAGKLVARIPEIRLRNIGSGNGVELTQLTNIIVKAVLEAVAKNGVGLSGVMLAELHTGLGNLASVPGGMFVDMSGAAADQLGRAIPDEISASARKAGDAVAEQAGRALDEDAAKAFKSLGGLFQSKKEE